MKIIFIIVLLFFTENILGDEKYSEIVDDFENGELRGLKLPAENNKLGIYFFCYPGNKLQVQIALPKSIKPDNISKDRISISITHQFDTTGKARTSSWVMREGINKNIWYGGDLTGFFKEASKSNYLLLRLDSINEIFKVDLKDANKYKHFSRLLKECSAKRIGPFKL